MRRCMYFMYCNHDGTTFIRFFLAFCCSDWLSFLLCFIIRWISLVYWNLRPTMLSPKTKFHMIHLSEAMTNPSIQRQNYSWIWSFTQLLLFPTLALLPTSALEKSCTQLHARWLLHTCFCLHLAFILQTKSYEYKMISRSLWCRVNIQSRPPIQIWIKDIRERTSDL